MIAQGPLVTDLSRPPSPARLPRRRFARMDGPLLPVSNDVFGLRLLMTNVYYVATADGRWVLIDAGLPGTAGKIVAAAEECFGKGVAPAAILLTHAHFDHIGALPRLLEVWDCPVYASPGEMPFLTGRARYAPPDPFVGGAMALLSPLYPRGPIDLGDRVRLLPDDGSVPSMQGWTCIPTPGHSPGHVSFFREIDRLLIAGDAITTTRQESFLAVASQWKHVSGPPAYLTHDWGQARESVRRLAGLRPMRLATGHGWPMEGAELREQLDRLVAEFDTSCVPAFGRYADEPVTYAPSGPVNVPPPRLPPPRFLATAALIGLGAATLLLNRGGAGAATRHAASMLARRRR